MSFLYVRFRSTTSALHQLVCSQTCRPLYQLLVKMVYGPNTLTIKETAPKV